MSTIPIRKGRYKYTDDVQMVADVIAGDEDALGYLLYVRFKAAFEVFFRKLVGDRKEFHKTCDDLVQGLYLELQKDDWKKLRKYDPSKAEFINYFLSVVYHCFYDQLKNVDSYKKNAIPMSDFEDENRIYNRMTTHPGINYESMYNGLMAVDKPPYRDFERDREIFDAILIQNEDKTEVAKRFNISERTVDRSLKKIESFVKIRIKLGKYF